MNRKNFFKYNNTSYNFSKSNYYKKKENKVAINIPEEYKEILSKNWPHPSVLSNSVLQTIPLDKFLYTEKIDGLNKHLLIFDKKVYTISKNPELSLIENLEFKDMKFSGDCIIETELYNDIYFIFDVCYLNKVDYTQKFIKERIESIKQYINELGPKFKIKNYYEIPDLNFLLDYIKKDKSPEGNDIDGVILQRVDKPYFQANFNDFNAYKLKPLYLNTVDFLIKYSHKYSDFELYLKGSYSTDYYNNFKKFPKKKFIYNIKNINKPINGQKTSLRNDSKVLIFFDSPFYPNLGFMKIDKNWNKNNYSEKTIKMIGNLIDKIDRNPESFNNKVVELSLTEDKKWVPLRIREDKYMPNSYRVGLINVSIIFDQIKSLESIYFQKNLSTNKADQITIHKINQIFRKYIIENHINYLGKYTSIVDLCGGRGADEFNLYSNGVSNFFVIDNDTTALKRYFDRTFNLGNLKYDPLTSKYRNNLKWGRDYITLNFLNYKLDKDYKQIKKDLYSRYEFNSKKKIDIVLMNFAIHYLCDEKEKLEELCQFVDDIFVKDGVFIITYFDGDEILKKRTHNFSKIGPFNIEILKEENDVTIAKMPLPTIKSGDNIYSEEPLVLNKTIRILEKYFDLYSQYFVYDKCKEYVDKLENVHKYIEYYKLIKVGVYYKKGYK